MNPCNPAVPPPGSLDNYLNSPDNRFFQIQLCLLAGTNWHNQHKPGRIGVESEIKTKIDVFYVLVGPEPSNTKVLDVPVTHFAK
jgi:hypothetical protein